VRNGKTIAQAKGVFDTGEQTISIRPDRKRVVGGKTYTIELTADDGASTVNASKEIELVTRGGLGWLKILAFLLLIVAAVFVRRRVVLARKASRSRYRSGGTNPPARTGTTFGRP
jgi:hypothetical protein